MAAVLTNEQRKAHGCLCRALRELCHITPGDAGAALGMELDPFLLMGYEQQNPKCLSEEAAQQVFEGFKALAISRLRDDPDRLGDKLRERLMRLAADANQSLADIPVPKDEMTGHLIKSLARGYDPLIEGIPLSRIRECVHKMRLVKCWSAQELAMKAGLSASAILQIEEGGKALGPESLKKVAGALECGSLRELWEDAANYPDLSKQDTHTLLVAVRSAHSKSKKEMTDLLDVTRQTYWKMEKGVCPTGLNHLVTLQHAFGYPTFSAMIDTMKERGWVQAATAADEPGHQANRAISWSGAVKSGRDRKPTSGVMSADSRNASGAQTLQR